MKVEIERKLRIQYAASLAKLLVSVALMFMVMCPSSSFAQLPTEADKSIGNAYWTAERKAEYSKRRLDSNLWEMDLFKHDLESHKERNWPTKSALSNFPSPVPEYENFGGSLGWPKLTMPGKHISTVTFSWGKYEVNRDKASDESHNMISYLNLFILTDDPAPEKGSKSMASRNFPHVLSTGKQKTSVGEVDWVQTGFADGNNYLIVNQRILDLNFGRTILVAPQKDGSLRFMQKNAPSSYSNADSEEFYGSIIDQLEKDKEVIEFFTNENTIGS